MAELSRSRLPNEKSTRVACRTSVAVAVAADVAGATISMAAVAVHTVIVMVVVVVEAALLPELVTGTVQSANMLFVLCFWHSLTSSF